MIAMDEAASSARKAALEHARAAARDGARRLPAFMAQQAKAARHRRRLAEAIRMGMAAASDEADYDARNKATGGSCTTDAPGMAAASDEADYDVRYKASVGSSTTDPPASDKAESLADIKGNH